MARSQLPFFFVGLLLGAVTGLAILWMASQNAFSESSSGPAVPGGMAPRAAAICGLWEVCPGRKPAQEPGDAGRVVKRLHAICCG